MNAQNGSFSTISEFIEFEFGNAGETRIPGKIKINQSINQLIKKGLGRRKKTSQYARLKILSGQQTEK